VAPHPSISYSGVCILYLPESCVDIKGSNEQSIPTYDLSHRVGEIQTTDYVCS